MAIGKDSRNKKCKAQQIIEKKYILIVSVLTDSPKSILYWVKLRG